MNTTVPARKSATLSEAFRPAYPILPATWCEPSAALQSRVAFEGLHHGVSPESCMRVHMFIEAQVGGDLQPLFAESEVL